MSFVLGFLAMIVLALLDSCLIFTRLSLVLAACVSLTGAYPWVIISGLGGVFCDLYSETFPFYTFLYLYISLGCVYLRSLLFKAGGVVFYIVSVVSLALFSAMMGIPDLLLFVAGNSAIAPLFYVLLKKELKSEKI